MFMPGIPLSALSVSLTMVKLPSSKLVLVLGHDSAQLPTTDQKLDIFRHDFG
jgi:hypothetical protein